MNRATAYFGFQLMKANPGETLILNSAAGAVGSIVGQLAKIKVILFIVCKIIITFEIMCFNCLEMYSNWVCW